jgi:hypothetical protein
MQTARLAPPEKWNDRPHPTHKLRCSEAKSFDELCVLCGSTDVHGGGWGLLYYPCKGRPANWRDQ